MRAKVYNQRQTNHHKLQATIMKTCKVTYQVSCVIQCPDDMPPIDASIFAEDLIIRPNFNSKIQGVKLVEENKVITSASIVLV